MRDPLNPKEEKEMTPQARTLNAPVITVVDPDERTRIDAAGTGLFYAIHRETVADAHAELKRRPVSAVLVSVARCGHEAERRVASVVREFPMVPTVALLGTTLPTPEALLQLGQAGVTRLVDVRAPSGWTRLRHLLSEEAAHEVERRTLAAVRAEVGEAPADVWRFFEAVLDRHDPAHTVRELSGRLGVVPSTLMSRFFRAGLPAPKRYLSYARLLRAARLFEDPGHSIADVATTLRYSSPQSFSHHIRLLFGVTAGQFRREITGEAMLRWMAELVRPHLTALRTLRPLVLKAGMPARTPTVRTATTLPPSVRDRRAAWQARAR
ncbi:MAG: helix-turn-helix transcriptional regulator [Gemmatimonadota bacterium]